METIRLAEKLEDRRQDRILAPVHYAIWHQQVPRSKHTPYKRYLKRMGGLDEDAEKNFLGLLPEEKKEREKDKERDKWVKDSLDANPVLPANAYDSERREPLPPRIVGWWLDNKPEHDWGPLKLVDLQTYKVWKAKQEGEGS